MIAVPLIALIVIGVIAVAWSPIFALVFFAIAFVLFLGYVGMKPRADQKLTGPSARGAEKGTHEPADRTIEGS